jgi:hypothetical protein
MVDAVAPLLRRHLAGKRKVVDVQLVVHHTRAGAGGAGKVTSDLGVVPTVLAGRPTALAACVGKGVSSATTAAFLCGPRPFTDTIVGWCIAEGMDYHLETFGY